MNNRSICIDDVSSPRSFSTGVPHVGTICEPFPLLGLRQFFYLLHPAELHFDSIKSADEFCACSIPYAVTLFVVEIISIAALRGSLNDVYELGDSLCSLCVYLVLLLQKAILRLSEFRLYAWAYRNYALFHLSPQSGCGFFDLNGFMFFIVSLLAVDFLRYWSHRACHEVAILWAVHRLHHSSERLNLFSALRHSHVQELVSWPLYMLGAILGIPPAQFVAHFAFNSIFPLWVHTQSIPKLPSLIETIIVTPSQHRVHHGRNAYCIDRNYANVLSFWDRLFGTHAEERNNEPIAYGTITPVRTHNPIALQYDFDALLRKWRAMPTLKLRLASLVMGPGWMPGSRSRLGDLDLVYKEEEEPDGSRTKRVKNPTEPRYSAPSMQGSDPGSVITRVYAVARFLAIAATCLHAAALAATSDSWIIVIAEYVVCIVNLYSFGEMLDAKPNAAKLEAGSQLMQILLHVAISTMATANVGEFFDCRLLTLISALSYTFWLLLQCGQKSMLSNLDE